MTDPEAAALRAQLERVIEWVDAEAKATKMWMYQANYITDRLTALLAVAPQASMPGENTEDLTHVDTNAAAHDSRTGGKNEIDRTMCAAGEWHRDGRGLWAVRRCQYYRGHLNGSHSFGKWRYNVQSPLVGEARSDDWDGGPLSRVPVVPRAETKETNSIVAAPRAEAAYWTSALVLVADHLRDLTDEKLIEKRDKLMAIVRNAVFRLSAEAAASSRLTECTCGVDWHQFDCPIHSAAVSSTPQPDENGK